MAPAAKARSAPPRCTSETAIAARNFGLPAPDGQVILEQLTVTTEIDDSWQLPPAAVNYANRFAGLSALILSSGAVLGQTRFGERLRVEFAVPLAEPAALFMRRIVCVRPQLNNGFERLFHREPSASTRAGTGTDAAPYFRIFNPILQSKKFDPDGAYRRRWVAELVT